MELQKYLDDRELKPTPWALKHGISPSVISRYLNEVGDISPPNARKIVTATGGVVTLEEALFKEKN